MKVLFVDDEPSIRDSVERMLCVTSPDTEVALAASGADALSYLQSEAADVVITDMRMPTMDGAELLAAVRESWPGIVRIVLTGETSYESAFRMVPVAHQYLLKPCSGEELISVITRTQTVIERLNNPAMRELVGGVSALPSLPETYRKLSLALDDPATPPARIASIIESNPPIAVKLMQLANSAFFSRRVATHDVAGAIVQLGINTVRHVVLQLEAFQLAATVRPNVRRHLSELQARSLRVADCARQLLPSAAQRSQAFMAGLLCDIGQVLLATLQQDRWEDIVDEAHKNYQPIEAVEKERMGVCHAEVGALLMGVWGLPHFTVESAACHHDADCLEQPKLDIAGAVCLANILVDSRKADVPLWERLGVRATVEDYYSKLKTGESK